MFWPVHSTLALALLGVLLLLVPQPAVSDTSEYHQVVSDSDGVRIPLEVYKDYARDFRVHPNSSYAKACMFDVGPDHYDLRVLGGNYEAKVHLKDGTSTQFRLSLCIEPRRCNGADNAAVCQHTRYVQDGVALAFIENTAGLLPMVSNMTMQVAPTTDSNYPSSFDGHDPSLTFGYPIDNFLDYHTHDGLKFVYAQGAYASILSEVQEATQLVEFLVGAAPATELSDAILNATKEIEEHIKQSSAITIVDVRCAPDVDGDEPIIQFLGEVDFKDGTWDGLPPSNLTPPAFTHAFGVMLMHKCACANSSCAPPTLEKEPRECVDFWEQYLQRNIPAVVIFILIALFERRRSGPGQDVCVVMFTAASSGDFPQLLFMTSFLLGTLFYPVAICHNSENHLLGSALGSIYCILCTWVYLSTVDCSFKTGRAYPDGAIMMPTLVCLVLLLGYFLGLFYVKVKQLVSTISRGLRARRRRRLLTDAKWRGWRSELWKACRRERDPLEFVFYETRVRELTHSARRQERDRLKSNRPARSAWSWWFITKDGLRFIVHKIYEPVTYFRYSPRIVSMAMVATFLLFEVTVHWSTEVKKFAAFVHTVVDGLHCEPLGAGMSAVDIFSPITPTSLKPMLQLIPGFEVAVEVYIPCKTNFIIENAVYWSFLTAGLVSCVVHWMFLLHMMMCYRKHLRFLPARSRNRAFAIVDALRYAGYQIAYLLSGWFILTIVICLVFLFIAFAHGLLIRLNNLNFCVQIVLPILDIYDDWFFKPILYAQIWVILIPLTFYILQVLSVYIFFQSGQSFVIVNQRIFHNVDFFVFFINIFVGLYSFIIRIILNVLFGLLWISRLDKNMMTRGYEFIDPGYRTYLGFLELDYHYCNPVMVTFASMLSNIQADNKKSQKLFYLDFLDHERSLRPGDENSDSVALLAVSSHDRFRDARSEEEEWEPPQSAQSALSFTHLLNDDAVKAEAEYRWGLMRAKQRRRNLVRNRWALFYTLVNNPQLRDCRKMSSRRRRKASLRTRSSEVWHVQQLHQQLQEEEAQASRAGHRCLHCGHACRAPLELDSSVGESHTEGNVSVINARPVSVEQGVPVELVNGPPLSAMSGVFIDRWADLHGGPEYQDMEPAETAMDALQPTLINTGRTSRLKLRLGSASSTPGTRSPTSPMWGGGDAEAQGEQNLAPTLDGAGVTRALMAPDAVQLSQMPLMGMDQVHLNNSALAARRRRTVGPHEGEAAAAALDSTPHARRLPGSGTLTLSNGVVARSAQRGRSATAQDESSEVGMRRSPLRSPERPALATNIKFVPGHYRLPSFEPDWSAFPPPREAHGDDDADDHGDE
ncbi:uncharacterized protein MONBRDRAFT_26692 [Monosiga brevicollis MX1]|uniref:TRP C-terminal domain-containing protein n=1 Tax=Monosiga brevicollis TaxID=81824 RepID=A9V333_MONBE|nr:uncharacterized protein MONBRDRAFT_26692 [Monosiga brevicollis MX1]EDQ87990.1 predicted protein [Monosiga brevicollis MX1]|eukprot:XP_001747066.1 hypothetical protein [Monosiga brevicollis MX1]